MLDVVEYKVPIILDHKFFVIRGNYIATRHSGRNKVSWHVARVIWIVGDFIRHNNDECDLADKVATHLGINTPVSVTSRGVRDVEFCFITEEDYGHMSKSDAIKKIANGCEDHNNEVISFSSSINSKLGLKKIIEF